ncbi:MAG: hypothetical protein GTN69_03450 [Armatimonadetes bacterium]|nr:hypothetical protein [Armatimonadota bacterium]
MWTCIIIAVLVVGVIMVVAIVSELPALEAREQAVSAHEQRNQARLAKLRHDLAFKNTHDDSTKSDAVRKQRAQWRYIIRTGDLPPDSWDVADEAKFDETAIDAGE